MEKLKLSFAQLKWRTKYKEFICAEPKNFLWNYYICPRKTESFTLYLMDKSDNFCRQFHGVYPSITAAKLEANKHYVSTLKQFIDFKEYANA